MERFLTSVSMNMDVGEFDKFWASIAKTGAEQFTFQDFVAAFGPSMLGNDAGGISNEIINSNSVVSLAANASFDWQFARCA
jgi:hypothetical protein